MTSPRTIVFISHAIPGDDKLTRRLHAGMSRKSPCIGQSDLPQQVKKMELRRLVRGDADVSLTY